MSIRTLPYVLLCCVLGADAAQVSVNTPNTALVLEVNKGAEPEYLYYGNTVTGEDMQSIKTAGIPYAKIYRAYGTYPDEETPLWITHADGNMTSRLVVTDVTREFTDKSTLTTVRTQDDRYPVNVDIRFLSYPDCDVIETWAEISHREKGDITLTRYDSACLPIHIGDVWVSHEGGAWGQEGRLVEKPLHSGTMRIRNKDGVRNSQTSRAELMLSLDGKPDERNGATIGAALCYSGNYVVDIDTYGGRYHTLRMGINPDNASYRLSPGETFVTPRVALSYSTEGKGEVSRNFHKWGRLHSLCHGDRPRKILLNSWEGVYFDISESKMSAMMRDIASLGGELFVMDDGWFGVKYPRKNDSSSLGDWMVDTQKLPNGINGLLESARKHGVKFGIWIEPEMTNTVSEFYEKHPDYVIKAPNRDVVKGRGGTQLVLDMANPKVQDVVFHIVDTLMTKYPDIDYIKWDANAPVMSHGSQYQTADNQSHLYIGYHEGLKKALERIRAKYPDVTIQLCASGGGRVNWGLLPWFDEFWTSDNTDALQRIYMQWGTSAFFPAIAMGSHISATPNHTTFRTVPIKFRSDVAMSGRLGMEIQPANMSEEDKALCRQAIEDYKKIRPVVQFGDLYRLLSPYDNKGAASLMYVNPEKDDAVFFWWKTDPSYGQKMPRVRMAGLNPDKLYTVTELNRIDNNPLPFEGKQFTGKFLMESGLEIPVSHDVDWHKKMDYSSRVLRLN